MLFTLCQKKCCFSCFLKSVNRSGAFFDFCVCVPKIVQSYFSSQSFIPKIVQSFSRKIVQSFSRSTTYIYIYIVEMGYFAAHSTWRYKVLGGTRYYAVQDTILHKVLCGARYYMVQCWQFFPILFLYQVLK